MAQPKDNKGCKLIARKLEEVEMAPEYSETQTLSGARHWPGKWINRADGIRVGAGIPRRGCQGQGSALHIQLGTSQAFQGLSGPSGPILQASASAHHGAV